ncbi:hypothetical protein S2091_1787 [Solimicrobium silvestre]|uniref:Uncharacterized protein n=1 Tax=Solimicrobium silvestre TaxID=2099400 RepID=A0A2S9H0C7_9BURK|nr:hypothetical protein S2091_1787 [Solimicrobium silvestre]
MLMVTLCLCQLFITYTPVYAYQKMTSRPTSDYADILFRNDEFRIDQTAIFLYSHQIIAIAIQNGSIRISVATAYAA